jgi:hypothetical protein
MKVRCRDCKLYQGERCEVKMKHMSPDTPRYCLHFRARTQQALEPWRGPPGWPP